MRMKKIRNLATNVFKSLKNKETSFFLAVFSLVFSLISYSLGEIFAFKERLFDIMMKLYNIDKRLHELEMLYLQNELEKLTLEIEELKAKQNLTENDKKLLLFFELRKKEIEIKLGEYKK